MLLLITFWQVAKEMSLIFKMSIEFLYKFINFFFLIFLFY